MKKNYTGFAPYAFNFDTGRYDHHTRVPLPQDAANLPYLAPGVMRDTYLASRALGLEIVQSYEAALQDYIDAQQPVIDSCAQTIGEIKARQRAQRNAA
jgi:hypothetical protein